MSKQNIKRQLFDSAALLLVGILLIWLPRYGMQPYSAADYTLFGKSPIVSLGVLLLGIAPLLYVLRRLKAQGVDNIGLAFFVLAAIVSFHYIHISNNRAYTNDLDGHLERIAYTMQHWFSPFDFRGWQDHHPPVYYSAAALFAHAALALQTVSQLTAMRYFSWACFLFFNAYNLLTLRRMQFSGGIYYCCAALLMLWPLGLHMASKMNPEPLYYAFYAASFYHALVWYQQGDQKHLRRALIFAGIAFTVRTSAIILFVILAAMMMRAFICRRFIPRRQDWRQWAKTVFILSACLGVYLIRIWSGKEFFVNHTVEDVGYKLAHFFTYNFDYAVSHAFVGWTMQQSTIDYIMKTAVFGEYRWPSPQWAHVLSLLLIALVFYVAVTWFFSKRADWHGIFPHIISLAISYIAIVVFSFHAHIFATQDARYMYPALVCFVTLFGRSCELCQRRGWVVQRYAGIAVAWAFIILSVGFFWFNAR
jgi:hypothetical protein